MSMKDALLWAASRDTGASSCAILRAALGDLEDQNYPLDTGDLGRCLRLLRAWPAARRGIKALATVNRVWAEIEADWARISAAARDEFVAEHRGTFGHRDHHRTYELLRAALLRGGAIRAA